MRNIAVVSVSHQTLIVSLEKRGRQRKPRLYLNEAEIGLPYERTCYPDLVEVVLITTSDGQTHTIANHTLPTFEWIEIDYEERRANYFIGPRWRKRGSRAFTTRRTICGLNINFATAVRLKPGMVLGRHSAFRMMDMSVTDGTLKFPLRRPYGPDWNKHEDIRSVQGISHENWLTMLTAICGLELDDREIELTGLSLQRVRERMQTVRVLRKRGTRREFIKGQCFDGKNCEVVAIGTNLVFTGQSNGQTIHIVDSPEYGRALYVFDDITMAHAWAKRAINAATARERAIARIVHTGEWVERTQAVIGA